VITHIGGISLMLRFQDFHLERILTTKVASAANRAFNGEGETLESHYNCLFDCRQIC
jgi:hypothetical protein